MTFAEKAIPHQIKHLDERIRRVTLEGGKYVTAFHLYHFVTLTHLMEEVSAPLEELAEFFMVSPSSMRRIIRKAEAQRLILVEEQWSPSGAPQPNKYTPYPNWGKPQAGDAMCVQEPPSPQTVSPSRELIPEPEATDQTGELSPTSTSAEVVPSWYEPYMQQMYLDGWDPSQVGKLLTAYSVTKETFDDILSAVKSLPEYWYPEVFRRSITEGKPVKIDPEVSVTDRAEFIRDWTLLSASRRKMRREVSLVTVYKRLEKAGLEKLATSEELNLWRKGRRVLKW